MRLCPERTRHRDGQMRDRERVPCGYVSCDRLMRRTLRCSALLAIWSWTLGPISPRNRVFVKFQKSIGFIYLRARPEPPCHAPCSPKAESQKSYQVDSAAVLKPLKPVGSNDKYRGPDRMFLLRTLRERVSAVPLPEGARVKVVEVPPGPPVISTLMAEIYGPSP